MPFAYTECNLLPISVTVTCPRPRALQQTLHLRVICAEAAPVHVTQQDT